MLKRSFDIFFALIGLGVLGPVILPFALLIYLQDLKSPFFLSIRHSKGGGVFKMLKLRSMVVGAEGAKLFSTAANDKRITPLGSIVRRYKVDEFSQLWNVLIGDMSFVGPRPQVPSKVKLYTEAEMELLSVRPGITDFASIIFSDEGDVLSEYPDADLAYNQIIRPWKGRLGVLYARKHNLWIDIQLTVLTLVALVSRPAALRHICRILKGLGVDEETLKAAGRQSKLQPIPPLGSDQVYRPSVSV